LAVSLDDEARLYAAAIAGSGADAYEQTLSMFANAEALLQAAGLSFRDVVRTWIHLESMERDYADFNRARRVFFAEHDVAPAPASTGIGAGPSPGIHDLSLGFYAVRGGRAAGRAVMTTPTLNEAPQYGADFSRGMSVPQGGGAALYVSGTASLDATGATVHCGDLAAQIERMLLNLQTLLREQGADFGDVASAITYLKDGGEAGLLQEKLAAAGFAGFPNTLVEATVCRPDLLCEIELLAFNSTG
jgi:enamine deaminase RidA (YjgF/YER057c/UK114 family)